MKESDWLYSEIVKDHFLNPKNILHDEKEFAFDGKGTEGNIKCGDEMTFWIQIDKEKKAIKDCRWRTFGCASAVASTSILSEVVKGMPIEKAYNITPKDIAKSLGGLPENKIHCSVLGDKALRAAIDDYYQKNGMKDKINTTKAKVICQCLNITDHDIEEAVLDGARSFYELQEMTKISTVCGGCKGNAESLLRDYIDIHFDDFKDE